MRMTKIFTKIPIFIVILLFSLSVAAQEITVSGRVTDKAGGALPGVSVSQLSTTKGATTNQDGVYKISVPPGAILKFSSLGFVAQLITVNNKKVIDVQLKADVKNLDEVVVQVGYSTMRKSDLTGAVSSIGSDVFANSVVTTLDQALQGRIAGLQSTMNSGVPGGGSSVQIRGVNSINSTNEPIYVIDGVIISGRTGNNDVNPLASINSNDIASVEVLKDASATAIYGSQGANGVVLITMKKGKNASPVLSFNARYGLEKLPKLINMMNLSEYAQHHNDFSDVLGYGRRADFSFPEYLGEGTNWQKELFKTAPMQSYDLSVRGGNKASTYSVSGGYLNQDAIVLGANYKRFVFRVNMDNEIQPWAKIGATVNVTQDKQSTAISTFGAVGNALFQSPAVPIRNADGSFAGPTSDLDANTLGFSNPVALAMLNTRTRERFDTRGNLYLQLLPAKGINFRTEVNVDANTDNFLQFLPAYQFGASIKANTENKHDKTYNFYLGWKNILNIDKSFGANHRTSLMLGQEMISRRGDYLTGSRQYGSNELTGLDAGDANYATNNGSGYNSRLMSFFGRATYNYKDRYLFTGTMRWDGSSNFAPGQQWGAFPSAAIAWRLSEEPFFKSLKGTISNAKLRLSYGIVGNSNVAAFAYDSNLSNIRTNSQGTGLQTANISNPNLTWETTKSWNAGMDLTILNNRVELVFDSYIKKTDDLLLRLSLPAFTGTSDIPGSAQAPWYNIGALQNKGFEFTVNTRNITRDNFSWKTTAIFTYNRNLVTRMNTATASIPMYDTSNGKNIITSTSAGSAVSQFYAYQMIGRINSAADFLKDNGNGTSTVITPTFKYKTGTIINNNDPTLITSTYIGDLLFADVNHDGIVNERDITNVGSPFPNFTFGLTNSFSYKNFDFSFFFNGSVGGKVFNILRSRTDDPRSLSNVSEIVTNYARLGYKDGNSANTNIWNVYVLPGANPSLGRMSVQNTNNSIFSDSYVEDASYLRLQNVSLGYKFPTKLLEKFFIKSVRVYTNLQNVFTFSKYSGYDPEVGSLNGQNMLTYGVDGGRIPSSRFYTFGLDMNF
ncbi:TonB-dependent receptor [Pedobacter sp. KBS0701]|uniref:SusC/RagA family TonB-linked outer membrane protein n=1 Tax=Pedobacter sp. KBS0701 TaxID=2578106 RepID=UPI001AEF3D43|nr:TonB-dependent receptor [Pedobacter sp. KBS0701]